MGQTGPAHQGGGFIQKEQGRAAQSASQDQALLFAAAELAMPFVRRSRFCAPHGQTLNRFPDERASAHAAAFVRILLSFE